MQNIEKQKQLDGGENGRMKEGAVEGIAKSGGAGIGLGINIPAISVESFQKRSLLQFGSNSKGKNMRRLWEPQDF